MSEHNDEAFLAELRVTFALEARDHLQLLMAGLVELEGAIGAAQRQRWIETVFREVHSLKGAARAVEQRSVEVLCQALEDVFAALQHLRIEFGAELADLLHSAVDRLTLQLNPQAPEPSAAVLRVLCEQLQSAARGVAPTPANTLDQPQTASHIIDEPPLADNVRIAVGKLDVLLRQAEGLLTTKLNAEQRVLDIAAIAADLQTLQHDRSSVSADAMLQLLGNRLNSLARAAQNDRQLLSVNIEQLLETIKNISMLPAASVLKIAPKLVRDLARESGKEVQLNIVGSEIAVDRRILEQMSDPLIHLLRNSIDHGIEAPAERRRCGKTAHGVIALSFAQQQGDRLEICIADDGAGIDVERVRQVALRSASGATAELLENADRETVLASIFQSGISTSPLLTDISGRGLGLAIVREKVEKLGGSIAVRSERGGGTQFRMVLPITLATYRGVHVSCGGRDFIFPTTQVEQVLTLPAAALQRIDNRSAINWHGRVLPVVALADLLGLPAAPSGATLSMVVARAMEKRVAFIVDAVLDEQEVLVKSLGSQLQRVRNIAGATRLRNGAVALLIQVTDLLRAANSWQDAAPPAAPARATRKTILVAEDSITSRMLLKGMLEAVGYKVVVAVDGAEALAQLRAQQFDLVISDVDMPRLNGLELTAQIRADKRLATLPVVLVTTLAAVADRERGAEVGANAYVVKSGFRQTNLLDIVRRLL